MFNIVLYQPQIPQNTGNIARTCAVTHTALHLIGPLGFRTDAGALKRAGLTYWSLVDIVEYPDWQAFFRIHQDKRLLLFSSKAQASYHRAHYQKDDFLIFGREDAGVPDEIVSATSEGYRIPMVANKEARCLNLATSVGIVLYEALRQTDFADLT